MEAEWWTNFTSGLVAGLLAPLLGWIFSRIFVRWRNRPGTPPGAPPSPRIGDHSIVTGSVMGPNNSQLNDNRRYETNNVYQYLEREKQARSDSSSSDADWVWIVLAGGIALGIGITYVLYAPLFLAAAIGSSIGVLVSSVLVIRKTRRLLVDWPEGATQTLISAIIAVLGTIVVHILLVTSRRDGISLTSLNQAVIAGLDARETINGVESNVFSEAVLALIAAGQGITDKFGLDGWLFFMMQTAALIIMFEVLILILFRILNWNTFLRFATETTRNRKAIERALGFIEKKWGFLLAAAVGTIFAVLLASQLPFDLAHKDLTLPPM
jgi:hypothetical protein